MLFRSKLPGSVFVKLVFVSIFVLLLYSISQLGSDEIQPAFAAVPDLEFTHVWSSIEQDNTASVDWGDWDGDGDLDFAVGNQNQPNRIYINNPDMTKVIWSTSEQDNTNSVDWGDWDGDGDLDLAVGNWGQPNRVYQNDKGYFSLAWSSAEISSTRMVAWGDWDGNGTLDLAVGNFGESNRVYANSGGNLTLAWSSTEASATTSRDIVKCCGSAELNGNLHRLTNR